MTTLPLAAPTTAPRPAWAALFDAVADVALPLYAAALGYAFRVGTDAALAEDARALLRTVWEAHGVAPPAETAAVGERYDRATTWIVAYDRGVPVGVMGLLDMRIATVSLDYDRRALPAGLDLARTRELGRLAIVVEDGAGLVMAGLLRALARWCGEQGVTRVFSSSKRALFDVYARRDPSARLVETRAAPPEAPLATRYFAPLRAYGGAGVHYTFEVAGVRPWELYTRFRDARPRA